MKLIFDIGHTRDKAREHPAQFTCVDWKKGKAGEVARALGFTAATDDSLEHMLNTALAKRCVGACKARGIEAEAIDRPNMENDAEINAVVQYVNAKLPGALISIHCNAAGGKGWKELGSQATGSVVLHYQTSAEGKRLAECMAARLKAYRRAHEGPDNRAESSRVRGSTVAMLRKTRPVAVLVEVCFYDSLEDLRWTVGHLDGLANAILDGFCDYLARKQPTL